MNRALILLTSVLAFLPASAVKAEHPREWTLINGSRIQASFEKRSGDYIFLRNSSDSKSVKVKYWDLRMGDRKYVDELMKLRNAQTARTLMPPPPDKATAKGPIPGEVGMEITGDKIISHDDRGTIIRQLQPDEEVVGDPYLVEGPNGTVRCAVMIVKLSPAEMAARQNPSRKEIKFQRKVQDIFAQHQKSIEDQVRQGRMSEDEARSKWVESQELMGHAVADHEGWSSDERLSKPATPDLPGFPAGVRKSFTKGNFADDDSVNDFGPPRLIHRSFGDK